MSILVFNAGSSSLKFSWFHTASCDALASGWIDWGGHSRSAELILRRPFHADVRQPLDFSDSRNPVGMAVRALMESNVASEPSGSVSVIGHRIVHGGTEFRDSVRLDASVKATIAQLAALAPLHNPPALDAINAAESILPGVPQVAVFDTSFFSGLPIQAHVYPLPYEWYTDWGIRRFGFHGISHAYCAGRAAELLSDNQVSDNQENLRLVVCHLGNGCSATAIRSGDSVATTMGFTPMEGLMMGTRSGSVDSGILLHVQRRHGLTVEQLERVLNGECGLLGVSGISSDFRQVEAAALGGNERAQLAMGLFADRVRAAIGALAVTLGGVDALVFTAGVGENSASLRETVCNGLECLDLCLDLEQNRKAQPDTDIATRDSRGRILVIRTREDLMIAREASRLLRASRGPSS